jgi:hypothetical protein
MCRSHLRMHSSDPFLDHDKAVGVFFLVRIMQHRHCNFYLALFSGTKEHLTHHAQLVCSYSVCLYNRSYNIARI